MSTCTMTNHHGIGGILAKLSETIHTGGSVDEARRELTQWTNRDLHDVGLSWSDVVREAEKPFWRA